MKEHVALKMRLKELAMVRVRFGYPQLTILLTRGRWLGLPQPSEAGLYPAGPTGGERADRRL